MESMSSFDSDDPVPRKRMKTSHQTSDNLVSNSGSVFSELKKEPVEGNNERLSGPKPKFKFSKPRVFLTSGLLDDIVNKAVERLGGKVITSKEDNLSATHMLAEKMSKCEDLLRSIAAGRWILHPRYITASLDAGRWLDEEQFEWGNPEANFLKKSSSSEAKLAKASRMRRIENSDGKSGGAFYGFRVILHLPLARKVPLRRLIEFGGGSVSDLVPPYSDPGVATHCVSEQVFFDSVGQIDLPILASRRIPVLTPIYLHDMLTEPQPVKVEDYFLEEFEQHWIDTPELSFAKMKALRVAELRARLAALNLSTTGLKMDLVQRLFDHQQMTRMKNKAAPVIDNEVRKLWLSGNEKLAKGQVRDAIELYTNAINSIKNKTFCTNPSIVEIYTSRSEAFAMEKRYHEALNDVLFVLELNSDDIKDIKRAAHYSLIIGNAQLGLQSLSRVPPESDDQEVKTFGDKFRHLEELKERAFKHFEIKDYVCVLELVDAALTISPVATFFIELKAKALSYQQKGMTALPKGIEFVGAKNYAQGLQYYCLGQIDRAIQSFQEAEKVIPQATLWMKRCCSLKKANLKISDLKQFGGGRPGGDIFNEASDLIPSTLNYRSSSKINKGQFRDALKDVAVVLSIVPGQTEALIKSVQCHLNLGNFPEANAALNLVLDPAIRKSYAEKLTKTEGQHVMILDFISQGHFNEAVNQIILARKNYPKNLNLILLQAECLAMQLKIPQAEQLLNSNDNEESRRNAIFLFVKGLCYYYKNKLNAAIKKFKDTISMALENRQQFSRVLNRADFFRKKSFAMKKVLSEAEIERIKENKENALAHYTSGLAIDTRNKKYLLEVYLCRAEVYREIGNYGAAVHDYEKAIGINSKCHEAWSGKGKAQMKNGKLKEAIDDLQKAYKLNGTNDYLNDLKRAQKMLKMQEEKTKAQNKNRIDEKKTYYEILGVSRNATDEQIKKAYHIKAKEFHPDRHMNAPQENRRKMEAIMKDIAAAHSCLSDPKLKQKYDWKLDHGKDQE